MSTLSFLAALPALLGAGGFALYALLRRGRQSDAVKAILESIAARTRQLPDLDARLDAKAVLRLVREHPELRQAIAPNDLIALQAANRKQLLETTVVAVVGAALVAFSMVLYFLTVRDESRRPRITGLTVTGLRQGKVTPLNTMDDVRVSWRHAGDSVPLKLEFNVVGSQVPGPTIDVQAADGSVTIAADRFSRLWPAPTLRETRNLAVVAQTPSEPFRFGPVLVRTGLNIVVVLERRHWRLSVYPKTANVAPPVDSEFDVKCAADAPQSAPVAERIVPRTLSVHVAGGRGTGTFQGSVRPSTLRCVYLGSYPEKLTKFQYLHD